MTVAFGNQEVLLAGARLDQNDVAGFHLVLRGDQTRLLGVFEPPVRVGIPQPVAFGWT